MGIRPEANGTIVRFQGRDIASIREADVAAQVTKLLFEDNRSRRAGVGDVNTVVKPVNRTVHLMLWIGEGESG